MLSASTHIRPLTLATIVAIAIAMLGPNVAWAQIELSDFSRTDSLNLLYGARTIGDVAHLTPPESDSEGMLWWKTPLAVADGFRTRFRFRMGSIGGETDRFGEVGGDGIAFVVQSVGGMPARGGDGGRIGYGYLRRSVAVEFDTYGNVDSLIEDRNWNHIAIHATDTGTGEAERHSLARTTNVDDIPDLSDGLMHTITVEYRGGKLSVYFDDCSTPLLEAEVDIARVLGLVDGKAWVGFTSSTGRAWETHELYTWWFRSGANFDPKIKVVGKPGCDWSPKTLSVGKYQTYRWSTGDISPTAIAYQPGTYWVEVTDELGCRHRSDTITLTAAGRPDPRLVIHGPTTLCGDDSVVIEATGTFESCLWSTGDTTRSIVVRETGAYTVSVVDNKGCDSVSQPINVRFFQRPTPTIAPITPRVCDGDSITLTAPDGFIRYRWSNGDTTRSTRVGSPGPFWVEVTASTGCVGRSAPLSVAVVNEQPPRLMLLGPSEICERETTRIEAPPGWVSYKWSTGDTVRSIVVSRAGVYSVVVTNDLGCVVASDSVTISAGNAAVHISSDGPPEICVDGSTMLHAPERFASYLWSTGETTRSIVVRSAGEYWLQAIDTGGCSGRDTIEVITVASPTADAGVDRSICFGGSVALHATGGERYRWTPTTGLSCSDCPDPIARPDRTTSYIVTAINGNGCVAFDTVTVVVDSESGVQARSGATICPGDTVQLYSSAVANASIRWYPADELSCSDCAFPIASPSRTTTYFVAVTNDDGCVSIDSTTIVVDTIAHRVRAMIGVATADPGKEGETWLEFDGELTRAKLDRLVVTLRFDPLVARAINLRDPISMLSGTTLDGWLLVDASVGHGEARLELVAPFGRTLDSAGRAIRLVFGTFLADRRTTAIELTVEADADGCVEVETLDGRVDVAPICGLSIRLIEFGASRYALDSPRPNPSSGVSSIPFSLGLDGPTRLRVFDATGREVARLLDEHLDAGEYEAVVTDLPSGQYVYRLESGDWVGSGKLVVR